MSAEERLKQVEFELSILKKVLLGSVDMYNDFPLEDLTLDLNWDEKNLKIIDEIFEEFEKRLEEEGKNIEWGDFENKLRKSSNIRYDLAYSTVKRIVKAFYKDGRYVDVCYYYAKAYTSAELHELIYHYENK